MHGQELYSTTKANKVKEAPSISKTLKPLPSDEAGYDDRAKTHTHKKKKSKENCKAERTNYHLKENNEAIRRTATGGYLAADIVFILTKTAFLCNVELFFLIARESPSRCRCLPAPDLRLPIRAADHSPQSGPLHKRAPTQKIPSVQKPPLLYIYLFTFTFELEFKSTQTGKIRSRSAMRHDKANVNGPYFK